MAGFVLDLVVGEAERGEAGGGVGLEAEGVAGLGRGGAVVAPAVGLDDEAEVGPEEVDLELVDRLWSAASADRRLWRAGGRAVQLVVGEAEGVLVEHVAKGANARLARVVLEGLAERVGIDHVALVGLVDRPLEAFRPRDGARSRNV